jgi:hypothetical protein
MKACVRPGADRVDGTCAFERHRIVTHEPARARDLDDQQYRASVRTMSRSSAHRHWNRAAPFRVTTACARRYR